MTSPAATALAVLPDRPLDVDPSAFTAASAIIGREVVDQLVGVLAGVGSGLAGTAAMGGSDPGGVRWATAYDEAAAVAVGGVADLANACHVIATLLAQSGFNHAAADAASNPRGMPPPDTTDYASAPPAAVPALPSASGGSVGPPSGWGMIQSLVGLVWPDGNPTTLRLAGGAWATASSAMRSASVLVPTAVSAIESVQSPEIEDAVAVCRGVGADIDDVAIGCRDLATACADYADHVEQCHRAIEDELVSLLAWTVAIEAAGAVVGVLTAGIGEAGAQVVEAGRLAATAARVGVFITRLAEAAGAVAEAIAAVVGRVAGVAQKLRPLLGARLTRATAEAVEKLPEATKAVAIAKGVPQGLTEEQFGAASAQLRAGTEHIGGELVVQGSRAAGTAGPESDIDFAIRVPSDRFDELIAQRFKTPNPGSSKEDTMLWAIETGKIQAGEAGLRGLRRSLAAQLGMEVDLSIIRIGGPFDNPPFIAVP